MAFKDEKHVGMVSNFTGNGIHCRGAYTYFQTPDPTGAIDPFTGTTKILDVATSVGFYSSNDNGTLYSEFVLDKGNLALSANNATLSNVTVWGANSILTQGRGDNRYLADSRVVSVNMSYGTDVFYGLRYSKTPTTPNDYFYAGTTLTASYGVVGVQLPSANLTSTVEFDPDDIFGGIRLRWNNMTVRLADGGFYSETGTANYSWSANSFITQGRADSRYATPSNLTAYLPTANFTWSNLTGKPTFATVATSGNYNDLSNTPAAYSLPTASATVLGGIKVGSNLTIANGVLSATSSGGSGGFQSGDTLNGGSY
jgi:hypothetical protein